MVKGKWKAVLVFITFPFTIYLLPFTKPVFAEEWSEAKGDHFIVYYTGNEQFAKDISRQSEAYYNKIADDLGYARYSNFWQWDNRVKIYVYPTKEDYVKSAGGQPEWSNGMADYEHKSILTYSNAKDFLEALLPHEITHLIFRDYVGFKGQIPLWLDEGVAQWQEPKKRAIAKRVALYLVQKQKVFPLVDLTTMSRLAEKDPDTVQAFYMQSVSIVDYMISQFGPQSFADFCRQLRDGKDLNEALRFAYSGSLHDLDELQTKWIKNVLDE